MGSHSDYIQSLKEQIIEPCEIASKNLGNCKSKDSKKEKKTDSNRKVFN